MIALKTTTTATLTALLFASKMGLGKRTFNECGSAEEEAEEL